MVVDSTTEQAQPEVTPGELEPEHLTKKETHIAPQSWNRRCSSERECSSRIMTGPQFGFNIEEFEESMSTLSYVSV